MRPFDPISFIEAGYRRADTMDRWLGTILDAAAEPLDYGLGLLAYRLNLATGEFSDFVCDEPSQLPGWRELVITGASDPKRREAVLSIDPVGLYTNSEVWDEYAKMGREEDCYALAFPDGEGHLHIVCSGTPDICSVGPQEKPIWKKLSLHLGAGSRLVNQPGTIEDEQVEAILEPNGKLLHAKGPAQAAEMRDDLRTFTKQVDRARTREVRRNPEEALDLWTGLVLGRWSLLDHFDSDGRRFIVARKNDPDAPVPGELTRRERQVAFYVSLGLGHKQVGYALGLSESTIATHLANVLSKLGLESREQLIELAIKSRST